MLKKLSSCFEKIDLNMLALALFLMHFYTIHDVPVHVRIGHQMPCGHPAHEKSPLSDSIKHTNRFNVSSSVLHDGKTFLNLANILGGDTKQKICDVTISDKFVTKNGKGCVDL